MSKIEYYTGKKHFVIHKNDAGSEATTDNYVKQLEVKLAEAHAYADKLAQGLPCLPKDVEVLQQANANLAQQLAESEARVQSQKENYDKDFARLVGELAEALALIRDCRIFIGNLPMTDESVDIYKRLQAADPFVPSAESREDFKSALAKLQSSLSEDDRRNLAIEERREG
jgi:hypothetical protein